MEKIYIDDKDKELVDGKKLRFTKTKHTCYVSVFYENSWVKLHRLIMGLTKESPLVVHHRDGNGLNNKRENLMICTRLFNNQSLNKINDPKFGYINYYPERNLKKEWIAYYTSFGKKYKKRFFTYQECFKYLQKQKEIELQKLKDWEQQFNVA